MYGRLETEVLDLQMSYEEKTNLTFFLPHTFLTSTLKTGRKLIVVLKLSKWSYTWIDYGVLWDDQTLFLSSLCVYGDSYVMQSAQGKMVIFHTLQLPQL